MFTSKEEQRKKQINKVVNKITTGDVNSKNFWDQLNKIGKRGNIETNNIVDNDGLVINDPSKALKFIEQYFKSLYKIREPTK